MDNGAFDLLVELAVNAVPIELGGGNVTDAVVTESVISSVQVDEAMDTDNVIDINTAVVESAIGSVQVDAAMGDDGIIGGEEDIDLVEPVINNEQIELANNDIAVESSVNNEQTRVVVYDAADAANDIAVESSVNNEQTRVVVGDAAVVARKKRIRKTPILPQKKTWLITHGAGGVQITKEMIERCLRNVKLSECYTAHDRILRYTLFRISSGPGDVYQSCIVRTSILTSWFHRNSYVCCEQMPECDAKA
jgi:hypothetical protein